MKSKKETERQMFLWDFVEGSGFEEYPGEELKEKLMKQFGQEIVRSYEGTKPSKGLWNSIKRSFGWGGYETQKVDVTLADEIKNMDREQLEEFWEPMAKKMLKDSVSSKAGDLARPISEAFKRRSVAEKHPDLDPSKLWDLALELNTEIPALRLDPTNLNSLSWIDTYIKEKYPQDYKKLVPNFEFDSPIQTIHDLVELTQKHDETDRKIIGSWLHSEKPSIDFQEESAIFPYALEESRRQWKEGRSSVADPAEKNRQETKSRSRTIESRLGRGTREGENDERNETKMVHKLSRSTEGKRPMLPDSRESR